MGSYRLTAGPAPGGGFAWPGPSAGARAFLRPSSRAPLAPPQPRTRCSPAAARHVLPRCRPPLAMVGPRALVTGSTGSPWVLAPDSMGRGRGGGPGSTLLPVPLPRAAGPGVSSRDPSRLVGNFLLLTLTLPGGPGAGMGTEGSQTLCGQLGTTSTHPHPRAPPQDPTGRAGGWGSLPLPGKWPDKRIWEEPVPPS